MRKKNVKIKYDKKLDNDKALLKQAEFYDEADIEEIADLKKGVFEKEENKRISMIIPNTIYIEAKKIAHITGAGYQNTLKTAMAIGLHTLNQNI